MSAGYKCILALKMVRFGGRSTSSWRRGEDKKLASLRPCVKTSESSASRRLAETFDLLAALHSRCVRESDRSPSRHLQPDSRHDARLPDLPLLSFT